MSTWKEIEIQNTGDFERVQSAVSLVDTTRHIIVFEMAVNIIQTNVPYRELRRWFSFVDVPLPEDIGVSAPTWDGSENDEMARAIGGAGVYIF